ncbi:uncharacterized protein [Parasteatoda tepidariorum]|uniref:uncharacterized protein n=1 Tax=Parasteatoda tepidariorum TaxID=114398 RepID=UPI0039BC33F1
MGKVPLLASGTPLRPIHFEFHHKEAMSISDTDELQEEDNDYDTGDLMNASSKNGENHVRERRSAKWSPDYDLYGQWAEEYYSDYESSSKDKTETKSKVDVIEKLIEKVVNQTTEESEIEKAQKRKLIEKSIMYTTWIVGSLVVSCCLFICGRRCLFMFLCDFCDPPRYKNKLTKMLMKYEPGVYAHKNGYIENYIPLEEEKEALAELVKLLNAL